MNARTIVLIAALALLGFGLVLVVSDMFGEPPQERSLTPAVAAVQIAPYTVISQDMIRTDTPVNERDAYDQGLYPFDSVVGLMSASPIQIGDQLTTVNAKPVEEVRFAPDFDKEIVTFQAQVDRAVGGQLRPGHLINIYGNGRDAEARTDFTELVQPYVTVVKVSASGRAYTNATPRADPETGEYVVEGGDRDQAVNLITVAVPPDQAFKIINAFGARGLDPWVTLAANQTAGLAVATPATPAPPPTAGVSPELGPTLTALWNAINATPAAAPPRTGFGGAR